MRSIVLKITAGDWDTTSCSRLFLSVQSVDMVTWATMRLSVKLATVSRKLIHSEKAVQVWNPQWEYPSRTSTDAQTASLTSHWRNKWSLLSSAKLQRQQDEGIFMPQSTSLDLVGKRSWCATQVVKACLGMWPLNQMFRVQFCSEALFLTMLHVLLVEKFCNSFPSISHT